MAQVWEKEFPICLGFFLYSQTLMSKLLAQCWSTDDEAFKGLELISCLLPSVVLETFQSDAFPRKFTDFSGFRMVFVSFLASNPSPRFSVPSLHQACVVLWIFCFSVNRSPKPFPLFVLEVGCW